MPNIPDEQKPAIFKVIAPAVLFWFRWVAMVTLITGLLLAHLNGYLLEAILLGTDGVAKYTSIGIGIWLGTIMRFNVWSVIWPNQKRALGTVYGVKPPWPAGRCSSRESTRCCRSPCSSPWYRRKISIKPSPPADAAAGQRATKT